MADARIWLRRKDPMKGRTIGMWEHAVEQESDILHFEQVEIDEKVDVGRVLSERAALGDTTYVEWLLEQGAPHSQKIEDEDTALHLAAIAGDTDAVDSLLTKGASVARRNRFGIQPIHDAAAKGRDEVVQMLLERGADIRSQDHLGNTPLHLACQWGHTSTVRVLLSSGADPEAPNNQGRTPLNLAVDNPGKYYEIKAILHGQAAPTPRVDSTTPRSARKKWQSKEQEILALTMPTELDRTPRKPKSTRASRLVHTQARERMATEEARQAGIRQGTPAGTPKRLPFTKQRPK